MAATYYEGMWRVEGTGTVWGAAGAQTLVFGRDPVRSIILYRGADRTDPLELQAVANSMLSQ